MLAKEGSYHVDCSDLFICRFLFGIPAFPSHTQLCYCILSIFNKAYRSMIKKKTSYKSAVNEKRDGLL